MSRDGKRYYIVDNHSRFIKVYLLKTKDEAEEMSIKYKAEAENQLDKKIKRLRPARGGKYDVNTLRIL